MRKNCRTRSLAAWKQPCGFCALKTLRKLCPLDFIHTFYSHSYNSQAVEGMDKFFEKGVGTSPAKTALKRNRSQCGLCCLIRLCKLQVMACPRDFHYHFCVADWRALRPGSYPSSIEQKKLNVDTTWEDRVKVDYFDCVFWGGKRGRQKQQVGRVPDTSVPSPPLKTVRDRVIECVSLICSLFRCGFAHGTIIFDIVHDSWAGKALLHQEMAALRQRRSDLKLAPRFHWKSWGRLSVSQKKYTTCVTLAQGEKGP